MAVLKALTRKQLAIIEANTPAPKPRKVMTYDAHVQAFRDHQIAEFMFNGGKVANVKTTGKALEAQKWFQKDYRSATPKGVVLLSARLRGQCARFAAN